MKVAVLGTGIVGRTLARGLVEDGHEVAIGSREGGAVEGWDGPTGTFRDVLSGADLAVLAVKGGVAEELARSLADALAGMPVIDTTNPIADAPPTGGVLTYFTGPNESLMERLQAAAPGARWVKAFNSVGAARMVRPTYAAGRPSMFLAGDDPAAKAVVAGILEAFGWRVEDMGPAAAARPIEALCQLWCILGFARGEWTHAFSLLHTDDRG